MNLHVDVLAGPESAADAREVQPHLLLGQAEAGRDLLAVHMQPLGRHVQVDSTVFCRDRETGLGSERCLILHGGLVVALHPKVGRGTVGVSMQHTHVPQHVAKLVQPWRARTQRLLHVGEDPQRLVLDGDPRDGASRECGRLRRYHGNGFAVIANDRVREHRLIVEVEAEAVLAWNVTGKQHRVHAGTRERTADVHVADRGVRVGRPERHPPEHGIHPQIARVRERPADLRDPVDARHVLAYAASHALPQPDVHRRTSALPAPTSASVARRRPAKMSRRSTPASVTRRRSRRAGPKVLSEPK